MCASLFNHLFSKEHGKPHAEAELSDAERAGPPDPHADRSAVCLGDADSALLLSQLELLTDVVRVNPGNLCGLALGHPLPGLERALATAGFDVARRFHSSERGRHLHRLVEDDGTAWHMTFGECETVDSPKALQAPEGWRPTARADFADWARIPGGRFRRHSDGAVRAAPARLRYEGPVKAEPDWACDFLADAESPADLTERIRGMEPLGLFAYKYVSSLASLVFAAGDRPEIPLLHSISHDEGERDALLSRIAARSSRMPAAMETFLERPPPPQVLRLFSHLREYLEEAEVVHDARAMPAPGHLWHIDTGTPSGAGLARHLKREAQRRVLAGNAPPGARVLIAATDWARVAEPDSDSCALDHPALRLLLGVPDAAALLERGEAECSALIARFPRRLWHRSHDEKTQRLARASERNAPWETVRLDSLEWGRRVHAVGDAVSRVCVRDAQDREAHRDILP